MSPEQAIGRQGTIGPSADIYSLGAVLYEMLTGRPPFKAETPIAMIQSQLSDSPTPPRELRAELPEWLDDALARALSKTPDDRFQSAADFRVALEEGLGLDSSARLDTRAQFPEPLFDTAPAVTPSGTPAGPHGSASADAPGPAACGDANADRRASRGRNDGHATHAAPRSSWGAVRSARCGVGVLACRTAAPAGDRGRHLLGSAVGVGIADRAGPGADATVAGCRRGARAGGHRAASTGGGPAATTVRRCRAANASNGTGTTARPHATDSTGRGQRSTGSPWPAEARRRPRLAEGRRGRSCLAKSWRRHVGHRADRRACRKSSADDVFGSSSPRRRWVEEQRAGRVSQPESGGIVVRDGKGDQIVKALPYQSVLSATYRNRAAAMEGRAGSCRSAVRIRRLRLLFQRSKHWLVLQSKDDFILRLEKENVAKVLLAIESRTGLHVQTVVTDNK
jgi:hypothetical protein